MLEKKVSPDEIKLLFGDEPEKDEEGKEIPLPEPPSDLEKTVKIEAVDKQVTIKPHNWADKSRLIPEQMQTLGQIHARFAQEYQSDLSSIMKMQTRITTNEPEQMKYEEFRSSIDTPTYINILALSPLDGQAALQIDLNLALTMIDRNLGGRGESYLSSDEMYTEEIRALSEIEQQVIDHLLESFRTCLRRRLNDMISGVQPTFVGAHSMPYFVPLALPEDIVIVMEFDIALLGEDGRELLESKMRICYPYMTLQPIVSLLRETRLYEVGTSVGEEKIDLNQINVPIKCNLVRETLSVEDLLNLKVGDGLEFDVDLGQASEVVVGKSRIFWGKPGIFGRKKSVKIESIITEDVRPILPTKSSILPPERDIEPIIPNDL